MRTRVQLHFKVQLQLGLTPCDLHPGLNVEDEQLKMHRNLAGDGAHSCMAFCQPPTRLRGEYEGKRREAPMSEFEVEVERFPGCNLEARPLPHCHAFVGTTMTSALKPEATRCAFLHALVAAVQGFTARCAVFCTVDVPESVMDSFLEQTQERIPEFHGGSLDVSQLLVFVESKDLSTTQDGSSMKPFDSPFLGQTIEEVAAWFDENITQPEHPGFFPECFVIMTSESVEEGICTVVSTQDGPREIFRCEISLAIEHAVLCYHYPYMTLSESFAGHYIRSGEVMTKENLKLVTNGGLYIEDGEVKVDQTWKDFTKW